MDAPSTTRRVVSLRGASAKEDSRDVLLEKIAEERAARLHAKRMTAAALHIQRIWRGCRSARIAANEAKIMWDEHVGAVQGIPNAEKLANEIIGPFIFFIKTTRHGFDAKDIQRIFVCFQLLLQSLKFSDERNVCTLAHGTNEQQRQWFYQIHQLLTICSRLLQSQVSTSLLALGMRLMVTFTDPKMLNTAKAESLTVKLLDWLADEKAGFYEAAYSYLVDTYNTEDAKLVKERFVVTTSVITVALRPLHAFSSESQDLKITRDGRDRPDTSYGQESEEISRYGQDRAKAAAQICRYLLTVPYLIDRIPAGLVSAFQHSSILAPCLHACKDARSVYNVKDIPRQAWIISNVISIISRHPRGFAHVDSVEPLCCVLQSLTPWIKAVQSSNNKSNEEDYITEDYVDDDVMLNNYVVTLKPLIQQEHVVQFLGKNTPITEIARLYTYIISVFSALNIRKGGALPVLNVLAFTKQLLPRLWDWIKQCMKLQLKDKGSVERRTPSTVKEENRQKWTNSFLKKTQAKNVSSESTTETATIEFHIEQLRKGPTGVPEEALPVLTLFCTVYGHLLLVLDDDEFYNKQVPFTIEEQKLICASLNTMIYHGFFLSWKQNFRLLMEASCRCLRALYDRDSRRSFCPTELWLAPAVEMRPAIAAAARAHEVASVESSQAPAIGSILTTIPHVLPFEERVQIFRELVKGDKTLRRGELSGPSIEISVKRGRVVEDGLEQLNPLGSRLKGSINVSFVNEYGLPEAGLDYGGLFKEFLTDLAKSAFDPGYGLFMQTATEERHLFPHPAATSINQGLRTMEFLGRIVGKALYEGILLEHSFSPVFISKILGRYSPIDDLGTLDIELHRNLIYLKNYEGDVSELALDFTITEEIFGKLSVIELIPGGAKVSVTDVNKLQYVHAMADYKLNRQVRPVVNAFIRGLTDLIAPSWLGLFNAREFNQLLSGEEHDFDVQDLKANTKYTGGYTETSRTVKLFWEVLEGLDVKERCGVLKFVTSCSRAPLLGFKHLQPPFTIHKVACDTPVWTFLAGQDVDRLPTASTCYNILKLPTYRRSSTLREKLQYAIRSNSGFELS